MHDEVTVVIPGAINQMQVKMNTETSDLDRIDELMNKIENIYNQFIKRDVHNRW